MEDNPATKNPLKTLNFLISIFIIQITLANALISPSTFQSLYTKHCLNIVPQPPSTKRHVITENVPRFTAGFFTGGHRIFNGTATNSPNSVTFRPIFVYKTQANGVFNVQANLNFWRSTGVRYHRSGSFGFRSPRIPSRNSMLTFRLDGYWSESTGKLCMVGSDSYYRDRVGGVGSLTVVLKLDFPMSSSIIRSLVNGTLESVEDDREGLGYFEPVTILGVSRSLNYEFMVIDKEVENGGFKGFDDGEDALGLEIRPGRSLCRVMSRLADKFELDYGKGCDDGGNCNPLGGNGTILPRFMYVQGISCPDNKPRMAMLIGFHNNSNNVGRLPFDPRTSLVAEGVWDDAKNRLYVVACRIKISANSVADASVGDCSVRLALRFPQTLSIKNRSTVVGKIWSSKSSGDPGYFSKISFRGVSNLFTGLPGLTYNYSEIERVRKSCVEEKGGKANRKYPNGYSSDMQFGMTLSNGRQKTSGYLSPIFVEDHFYGQYLAPFVRPFAIADSNNSSLLKVSYKINFKPLPNFMLAGEILNASVDISAEGTYNTKTGKLCMVGCRQLGSISRKLIKGDAVDCDMLITIQFSPLDMNTRGIVRGSIESTRLKSDPLYFGRVELSSNSIYTSQAEASIWRMDMEIALVLVSNTLLCLFVGLQIFHVKRNPDMLPLISFLMLVLLTLGQMIPLLLNFEAFFATKTKQQNFILQSGGWLEVNEVIVRLVTMVAFLLHSWLLQMALSARKSEGRQQNLWAADKRVSYVTIPLYVSGGLIAWLVHLFRKPARRPLIVLQHLGRVVSFQTQTYQSRSLWSDLRSYAGLLLDGFLLPQIIFNVFSNSKQKALCAPFYIGITIVRLLPHAYDIYRAHTSSWSFDSSYIYANHRSDYYSTGWDIIIICGGLFFGSLVYLQQRSGGHSILPKRFRERSEYELVPVVNGQRNDEAAH